MAEISAFQRSIGENISARRFLADAVRLAHGVSGDETDLPGAVFRDMVDRLIDGDATDYALEVAEEIVDDSRRDRVLALIAGTEAASGRFDAARNAIDGIANPKRRQAATGPLIVARARDGDIETALAEASALANDDGRVSTLAALAEVLVKAGRTTEALDLVRRVHDEQADMDDTTARLEAVNKALAAQIKAGDGEGAEKAAAALTVDSVTGWVFRLMTDAYAEAGDYDAAFATAARVGSEFFRGRAYQTVAWAAADAGQFGSAEQAVAAIDSAPTRVRTRVRLAECQAAAGLSEAAKGTLDRALSENRRLRVHRRPFKSVRARGPGNHRGAGRGGGRGGLFLLHSPLRTAPGLGGASGSSPRRRLVDGGSRNGRDLSPLVRPVLPHSRHNPASTAPHSLFRNSPSAADGSMGRGSGGNNNVETAPVADHHPDGGPFS